MVLLAAAVLLAAGPADLPPVVYPAAAFGIVATAMGILITVSRFERGGMRGIVKALDTRVADLENDAKQAENQLRWRGLQLEGALRTMRKAGIDVPLVLFADAPPPGQPWPTELIKQLGDL